LIYPRNFPFSVNNPAEEAVFEKLRALSNKYDIFYSRRFLKKSPKEKDEYEIDFIIADPGKFVLCLEVKGGIIRYEGKVNKWFQNDVELNPSPDIQSSSNSHSLIERYAVLSKYVPVEWAVSFPDCEISGKVTLPANISRNRVLDREKVMWLDKSLPVFMKELASAHPGKKGCKDYIYDGFKSDILRDLNFIQKLGTTITKDEDKFIELTETQNNYFSKVLENKKIITRGPSGSGKTIIAKTLAKDFASEGKKVLLLCYNRTLANKIRYETGINRNELITVDTFHSLARDIIAIYDDKWWDSRDSKPLDFWEIELPSKFEEVVSNVVAQYDVLIIDEGQDFGELWFDVIFKMVKSDGCIYIFLDEFQNIFSRFTQIPNEEQFLKYKLDENCRNTKKIVKYLEGVSQSSIKCFPKSPDGTLVTTKEFENQAQEFEFIRTEIHNLTANDGIKSEQILLITNTDKADSCINNINKIGNYTVSSLDRQARLNEGVIHYTTINVFKGLETDVLFILDANKIDNDKYEKTIYTEASRAKHKLYILNIKE
jgi:hypothetical protein